MRYVGVVRRPWLPRTAGHGVGVSARSAGPAIVAGFAGQAPAASIAPMARRLGIGSRTVGNLGPGAGGGLIGNSGIAITIEDDGPAPASFTPRSETRVPSSGVGLNHVDRTPVISTLATAGVQRPSAIRTSQRSAAGVGRNSDPRHHKIVTLLCDHEDRATPTGWEGRSPSNAARRFSHHSARDRDASWGLHELRHRDGGDSCQEKNACRLHDRRSPVEHAADV